MERNGQELHKWVVPIADWCLVAGGDHGLPDTFCTQQTGSEAGVEKRVGVVSRNKPAAIGLQSSYERQTAFVQG